MRLPAATLRLFPQVSSDALGRPEHADFVIGRLLEEGDTDDLRWLVATHGEAALAAWLSERGRRQLSRRSFAFWATLLDDASSAPFEDPLWPL